MPATVTLDLSGLKRSLRARGLEPGGRAQQFFTQECARRMTKYMPMDSGALIKLVVPTLEKGEISIAAPQAHYLYIGKLYVDPETGKAGFLTENGWRSRPGVEKAATNRDLTYDTTKNALAGPNWDQRMWAAEKDDILGGLAQLVGGRIE